MGSFNTESFDEFIESLKHAGIDIVNEREVRERLGEVSRWREAFNTIARNSSNRIGIAFKSKDGRINKAEIHRAFMMFQLPAQTEAMFTANLEASL